MSVEDLGTLALPDVDLDLTANVPCSMDGCEAPATWAGRVICSVCPVRWFPECTEHKAHVQRRVAGARHRHCEIHPRVVIPPPYIEWRPL